MLHKIENLDSQFKEQITVGIINYLKSKGLQPLDIVEVANNINEHILEFVDIYRDMQIYLDNLPFNESEAC